MWGVRRRSVLLLVVLLVVAFSVLSTSEAAGKGKGHRKTPLPKAEWVRRVYNHLLYGLRIVKTKTTINPFKFTRVWMQAAARTINRPFSGAADVYNWRNYVAGALKQPYFDRNPWVRCVKSTWPRCVKMMHGVNVVTAFSCPWHTYWQCESANEIARHTKFKGGYKPFSGGTPRFWVPGHEHSVPAPYSWTHYMYHTGPGYPRKGGHHKGGGGHHKGGGGGHHKH